MLLKDDSEISILCRKITKICTRPDGSIDQKDLNRRLGMLFTDRCLDYFKYLPKPTKPQIVMDFDALSKEKKAMYEKENSGWRDLPSVQEYSTQLSTNETENYSNVHWMKYWMDFVDDGRKVQLRKKLEEFPNEKRYVPPVRTEKEAKKFQSVAEMFKGEEIEGDWRKHTERGLKT